MAEPLADQVLQKIKQAPELYHKLVLIIGPAGTGKTTVLQDVKERIDSSLINVNLELSRRMLELTKRQRALKVAKALDEILTTVKSIPYYKEVLMDLRDDKEDWAVTQTVKRYADYWMEHPESLTSESFPPIQVIGDGLKDGAHRISTLNALANHIDPDNSYWTDVKLEVRFYPIEVVKDIGPTFLPAVR